MASRSVSEGRGGIAGQPEGRLAVEEGGERGALALQQRDRLLEPGELEAELLLAALHAGVPAGDLLVEASDAGVHGVLAGFERAVGAEERAEAGLQLGGEAAVLGGEEALHRRRVAADGGGEGLLVGQLERAVVVD